ncbi:class F sortase [Janibacter sp. LM]|uniref:class F sortase n=1 Tax=Janibacter TaxID=53457 RepID=UPI0031F6854F
MTTPPTRRERGEKKRYQRGTWLLAAAVALVIGGGVAGGAWWTQRDDEAGVSLPTGTYVPPSEIMPSSSTPSSSTPSSSRTTRPKQSSTPDPSPSAARRSEGTAPAAAPAPAGEPTRVQVRSGGTSIVDASLVATRLDAQKVLAPPFGTAGWYAEPGWPKPGHRGASILAGHINHGNEPDVFWNLPRVKVGDIVTVTYGDGRTVKFSITRSEAMTKEAVPRDDSIWDWDNPEPVLRLITCDPETPLNGGHYEGNWVVWAEQVVS